MNTTPRKRGFFVTNFYYICDKSINMFIDYESPKTTSKTVWFNGETEDGKKFTIIGNWDEWEDWSADPDSIMWDGEEGSDDEKQEIVHEFLNEMNG